MPLHHKDVDRTAQALPYINTALLTVAVGVGAHTMIVLRRHITRVAEPVAEVADTAKATVETVVDNLS